MEEIKETKVCSKCKVEKPISDFSKDKYAKDGLNYWCRECRNEVSRNKTIKKKEEKLKEILLRTTKVCLNCGEEKLLDEFGKDKNSKDGLNRYCKICNAIKSKEWQINNREKMSKHRSNWKKKNRDKVKIYEHKTREKNLLKRLIYNCRKRAKERNILCDDINILYNYLKPIYDIGECEFCHCKLESGFDKRKANVNSPSIDKIDPNSGYTIDNVAILCYECNTKKRDNTYDDFKNWIYWYEKKKNLR